MMRSVLTLALFGIAVVAQKLVLSQKDTSRQKPQLSSDGLDESRRYDIEDLILS